MSLNIRFHLDWNEYYEAKEFLLRDRYPVTPEKIVGGLLLIVSALWFFLDSLNMYAILGLAAGLAVPLTAPMIRRWNARRKWQREPFYRIEHIVSVSEDGVEYLMGQTKSDLTWLYYQRMIESPAGFLLIYGNDSFNFLPKRAFQGEEMIIAFREMATKKLKGHEVSAG
ncbi:MAG: YcxB family protein [Acidobacteria bacterium]|nr:YcxB family protein [Acidobacteriota bacterium]